MCLIIGIFKRKVLEEKIEEEEEGGGNVAWLRYDTFSRQAT